MPRSIARRMLAGVLATLRLPAVVFACLALGSGDLRWSRMWLLLGLLFGLMALNLPLVALKNPTLLAERFQKRGDTKPFDRVFGLLSLPLLLVFFLVAGLDGGRFHASATALPAWSLAVGIFLHALGDVPILWAMITNPHLETTVRIQSDRQHRVVRTGPYRFVRHPMYTGMLLMFSGWPLVLDSLWAYLPLSAFAALLVWRTSREDRALLGELTGYAEYAAHTRYRLLPRVW